MKTKREEYPNLEEQLNEHNEDVQIAASAAQREEFKAQKAAARAVR